jgi:uncharacterized membrane protein
MNVIYSHAFWRLCPSLTANFNLNSTTKMTRKKFNKEKLKRFAHILAAVTILMHAYRNYEEGLHSYPLFVLAGIIVLALALFHPILEKKLPWIDGTTFFVEGILSITIGIELFDSGRKALSIGYLLLGLFQFYMAFRKGKKGHEKHRARHQITN